MDAPYGDPDKGPLRESVVTVSNWRCGSGVVQDPSCGRGCLLDRTCLADADVGVPFLSGAYRLSVQICELKIWCSKVLDGEKELRMTAMLGCVSFCIALLLV